ncbi:Alpha/Beta hydrolase protein [Endogone sp. FLAS-F59071]|nr:Alpha/Beta hydrolase protein [Endogone sp. FLAS-F59071]|eukprot:RUS18533.1 Alpha/Beta hydrolase protein [Endogone sp. FLAS-F59071]
MPALTQISGSKAYGGNIVKYSHQSAELSCTMQLNVFLPKEAERAKVPVLYCLAGITCTEDNFSQKSGALREAAKYGLALVFPDTSPRNVNIEGEDDSWDFGSSAGFYLNATQPKWSKHYRMYSYIVDELPSILNAELAIDGSRISIIGHSMGGHGALTIYLKNLSIYKSASAISPIVNPINCSLGQKAFTGYLGDADKEAWREYDAIELLKKTDSSVKLDILVDVGSEDEFLERELLIPNLSAAAKETGREGQFKIRLQEGYNHSYYFVASMIEDHIAHHAKYLKS